MIDRSTESFTYVDKDMSLKGEPINLLIVDKSLSEAVSAIEKKGWKQVPTFSAVNTSTWEFSIGQGITPISPRYLKGKVQDASLEGPDSTVRKRHHIRLWEINSSVYCTVSYDSDVTITLKGILPYPTHRIGQDIDSERKYAADSFKNTFGSDITVSYRDNSFPALFSNNHAGSWYFSDGESIVIGDTAHQKGFDDMLLSWRRAYFNMLALILNLF